VDVLETEPELIDRLWDNTRYFKGALKRLGFDIGQSETPITPVIAGSGENAYKLSDRLFEEGVFAQGIGYPTVPEAKSRVRTIITAAHTQEQMDTAIGAFEKVGRELGLI
jgi:glycine C-acetyltransferase